MGYTKPTIKDKLVENPTTSGVYTIDYNYDTWLLTLTGNTTLEEINLPVSGVNTKPITIHVYLNGNTLTLVPGWEANRTGDLIDIPELMNTITVEFIKDGKYRADIFQ